MTLLAGAGDEFEFHSFVAALDDDGGFFADFQGFDGVGVIVDVLDFLARQFHDNIAHLDARFIGGTAFSRTAEKHAFSLPRRNRESFRDTPAAHRRFRVFRGGFDDVIGPGLLDG